MATGTRTPTSQKTPRATRAAFSAPVADEAVAELAYELFQQRGGEHGHDLEDWLEAERRVRQTLSSRRS
jgi:hypothetical protein